MLDNNQPIMDKYISYPSIYLTLLPYSLLNDYHSPQKILEK